MYKLAFIIVDNIIYSILKKKRGRIHISISHKCEFFFKIKIAYATYFLLF